jgi:hypothetical protein
VTKGDRDVTKRAHTLRLALLCLLLLGTGCPPKPVVMTARQEGKLSVSLRTMLVTPTGERAVEESETLHSGDRVYFLLRASQAAYLYVVLFGPDGSATTLYPTEGGGADAAIAARCPVRLPAKGTFNLKSPAGPEDIRVVAATRPLAVVDRRLCEQLRLPCQPSTLGPPQPPPCQEEERAIFSSLRVATASASGVATLRVTLQHDP